MFVWVLRVHGFGVLSAVLGLAIVARLVDRRLMPGRACLDGALVGFCGWAAFIFFVRDGNRPLQAGSLTAIVWWWWVVLAPMIVPLEAGLLGWLGTQSIWRWFFLGAGVLLALWLAIP
jgi:hypothetical protein